MKTVLLAVLTVALGMMALPARASDTVARKTRAIHQDQVLQKEAIDRRRLPGTTEGSDGVAARAVTGSFGGRNGPYANPYRTYPPSCMADPLPLQPTGPVWGGSIDLAAWNFDLGGYVREPVTVSVWRVPCSSVSHDNAITLLRIERAASREGDTNQYAMFPAINIAQGDVGFDSGYDLPRIAEEPNTIVAWTPIDSPLVYSTTYVLEALPLPDQPFFDYTQPFQIRFDNYIDDGHPYQYRLSVPAYNPGQYSDAGRSLPINGYMSNNYYDPAHSGEGMVVQVYEVPSSGLYMIGFNWFTYDDAGEPFWITGTAAVSPGSRTATATDVGYLDNGGFAGDFGASADRHPWGTVTFEWLDCRNLKINYEARSDLPSWVPQGSGSRIWRSIINMNGLTCE